MDYIYNGPSGTVPGVGTVENGKPIATDRLSPELLAEWTKKKWLTISKKELSGEKPPRIKSDTSEV